MAKSKKSGFNLKKVDCIRTVIFRRMFKEDEKEIGLQINEDGPIIDSEGKVLPMVYDYHETLDGVNFNFPIIELGKGLVKSGKVFK